MTARCRRCAAIFMGLLLLAACSTTTSGTAVGPTALASSSSAPPATTADSVSRSPAPAITSTTATVTTTVTAAPASPDPPAPTTTTAPPVPEIPPTDLAGAVYAFITAVDLAKSEITLDKVDWFTGAAAQQACAEDGVTSTDNNRCTGYYYRNVNPALRTVAVSSQATMSTLDGSRSVPSDLATVAGRISTTTGSTYHLVVTDGVITDLQEMYHP